MSVLNCRRKNRTFHQRFGRNTQTPGQIVDNLSTFPAVLFIARLFICRIMGVSWFDAMCSSFDVVQYDAAIHFDVAGQFCLVPTAFDISFPFIT